MGTMHKHLVLLGAAVALVAAACGSDARITASTAATPTVESATTQAAESTTTAVAVANEATYATKYFTMPFDVTLPTWLPHDPSTEQPNFVTWTAPDRAVRFLIPVNVYAPGGTATTPPPTDYLAYLLGQTDHGAHFADTAKTTVGGKPATIMTATTDDSIDGSLGCPDEGMSASDCFGLQPEFALRIAVVDLGDKTLLVWLRNDATATGDQTEVDSFEQMLTNIQFSDRAVEAAPEGTASPLDGTYTWTITSDDALAHGTPGDKTPENLAAFPWDFTITMNTGTMHLTHRDHDGVEDDGVGTYIVANNQLALTWARGAATETFTYTVDGDGTLHLVPVSPMDSGDQFVEATNPWKKIADASGAVQNAVATPLDGTYQWTITSDDALAHGLPGDKTPASLATFPWTFTLTMTKGTWSFRHRDSGGDHDDGGGTYTVDGNHIAFDWQTEGYTSTYNYTVDGDGTLHLDAQPPINLGDQFVWSTNPWSKVG